MPDHPAAGGQLKRTPDLAVRTPPPSPRLQPPAMHQFFMLSDRVGLRLGAGILRYGSGLLNSDRACNRVRALKSPKKA